MRFSDGPTNQVSVEIDASPEMVWDRITDVSLPASHSNELQRAEWADPDAGARVGATIVGYNERDGREWQTTSTVTRFEPAQCFEWTVDEAHPGTGPVATWAYELEPLDGDESRTRLTQRVRLGPGGSGLTSAIEANPDKESEIIAARLAFQEQAMRATLDALKNELETS